MEVLASWIPRAHDNPSIRWIFFDLPNHLLQLVDALALIICLARIVGCAKVSPLESVHRTEIPNASMAQPAFVQKLAAGIAIPNLDAFFGKVQRVGISTDEPEEFFDDGA